MAGAMKEIFTRPYRRKRRTESDDGTRDKEIILFSLF